MLSRELGATVEIDTILTGWQGWNPELVVRGFRIRERRHGRGDAGQPLIELPEVRGVVSWTSLLTADLRLARARRSSARGSRCVAMRRAASTSRAARSTRRRRTTARD